MIASVIASNFAGAVSAVRTAVDSHLERTFAEYAATDVLEAARYTVLGGGRRWRAIVAVAAGQIFHSDSLQMTLPGACGVELAHAASLLLDDLPSMDNAKARRGKPCTHLVFPRWAVDLTPVFILTMAYQISLNNPRVSEEMRLQSALEISSAGLQMITGQSLDILGSNGPAPNEPQLLECYQLKTGVLYGAAAKIGAILCGATADEADAIYSAGLNLGISFQVLDDIEDSMSDETRADAATQDADKWTSVDWLGIKGAVLKSREFRFKALSDLQRFGDRAAWLRAVIREATGLLDKIEDA
jgi:geranylgeranyl diphosphate synthase type II